MMREILSQYFETEVRPGFSNKDNDPWWDPVEPILVGTSYLGLRPLCYAMGSEQVVSKILHSEGMLGQNGQLVTEFDCTDREGNTAEELYEDVEEKDDLIGKELHFKIDIKQVRSLPEDLCTNPFITYALQYESHLINTTPESRAQARTHSFSFSEVHSIFEFGDAHYEYFDSTSLAFRVFAYPYYLGANSYNGTLSPAARDSLKFNDPRLTAQQKKDIEKRMITVREQNSRKMAELEDHVKF